MLPNIIIKPGKTINYQAIIIDRIARNVLSKTIFLLIWISGLASILVIAGSFARSSFQDFAMVYLPLSYLGLALFLIYLPLRLFYQKRILKKPSGFLAKIRQQIEQKKNINLFEALSFETAKALAPFLAGKKINELSLADLSLALSRSNELGFIMIRLGLGREDLVDTAEKNIDCTEKIFLTALDFALANNHEAIEAGDLLLATIKESTNLQKMLQDLNLEIEDIHRLILWQTEARQSISEHEGFFNPNNLKKNGGFGRDWIYGYANTLRRFSQNITEAIEDFGLSLSIVGRDREIGQIEEALTRQGGRNAIVVGNAGVGKHTTILGFAKKVIDGKVSRELANSYIYQVDTEALLSAVQGDNNLILLFSRILNEAAAAGNAIVLIENIDHLFSADGVGKVDMTAVLMPYLEHGGVRIIGTCEVEPYNQYILPNNSLSSQFVRVSIKEPNSEDLITILENTAPLIEYKNRSVITLEAIKAAIKNSDKYIVNFENPEKSIDLLEGAATKASAERGETIVLAKDIESYMSEKFDLPIGQASDDEKSRLLELEKSMHETVIGQDEAILAVANAMRRARAQITDSRKPIGSFLFLGPTGVGKTATAKALARAYFGGADKMIRFDMSEYQNAADIYRLIGQGEQPGNLTTFVNEKPFSLILFDEIEKAYPDILNLFLQILDEGILTDGRGKKVLFANTIIIATSNAGSDLIQQSIKSGENYENIKNTLNEYLVHERIFKPEFLNRFTGVIAFSPLTLENIRAVAKMIIADLEDTVMANQGIKVSIDDEAIDQLAELGFDPEMGARPMERVIQEKVENLLAEKILRNELKKGDSITITKEFIAKKAYL